LLFEADKGNAFMPHVCEDFHVNLRNQPKLVKQFTTSLPQQHTLSAVLFSNGRWTAATAEMDSYTIL